MWTINVKPKQIYLDETKAKVEILQIHPANFEPEVGLTFRVAGCTASKQEIYKTVQVSTEQVDEEGNGTGVFVDVPTQELDHVLLTPNFELEAKLVKIEGEEYLGWTGGDLPYLEDIILRETGNEKL